MPNEERIDLVVSAQTQSAQKGFGELSGAVRENEKALLQMRQQLQAAGEAVATLATRVNANRQASTQQSTAFTTLANAGQGVVRALTTQRQATDTLAGAAQQASGSSGIGGLANIAQTFFKNAAMGRMDLHGLAAALGAINPVAGAVATGLLGIGGALKNLATQILPVVSAAQTMQINLESLAAVELVKSGQFDNAAAAMDTAQVAAADLLQQLRLIDIESPFDNTTVIQTFQSAMAFGFVADQALTLTRASLNMAAGLGKSGAEMAMVGLVMGQIRSTGKLMMQDLNQLRSRGINLADMLRSDLGVSVEQFNAGLAAGTYTMDDLLNVFDRFATTNFAGAGKRLAQTFQGLQDSLKSLKDIVITTTFKPAFDKLTAAMAGIFEQVQRFAFTTPLFKQVGAYLAGLVDKALALGQALWRWVQPGLAIFQAPGFQTALRDAAHWAGMIGVNLQQVGQAIWRSVKPAFEWLTALLPSINLDAAVIHFRDTTNALGLTIYYLVETIRRVLTGNAAGAFDPLRQAVSYTLTWLVLTWDRFGANAIRWGWNLVVQLADGIVSAARTVLQGAMNVVGTIIGWFIKPGSPPEKGPLSHIVEWGRGLITTYVHAFKSADFSLLKESLTPIRQALQQAVSMGNLGAGDMPQILGQVREAVARLISEFRMTGVVSEEVLGNIAAQLGAGGAEMVQFLRLQLRFQQAQSTLASVSAEVAEAQKRGFVPQALGQKLKAAQAAAEAAQDELSWQREYLDLQNESVDIQLQLIQAIKQMGQELGKAADKIGGGIGGGGAPAVPTPAPFTSTLGQNVNLGAIGGDLPEELTNISAALGGVSTEFQSMRQKVDAFLALPLDEKLIQIGDLLGLGGIRQFLETFNRLPTDIKIGYIKSKLEQLLGIDIDGVLAGLQTLPQRIWQTLLRLIPQVMYQAWHFVNVIFKNLMDVVARNAPTWGQDLGYLFGKLVNFIFLGLGNVAAWLVTEGPRLANAWLMGVNAVVMDWLGLIAREGPGWLAALWQFASGFIVGFVTGFLENAPEWVIGILRFGDIIIGKIKEGLTAAWDLLTDLQARVEAWVRRVVLVAGAWLYNLREVGKKVVQKIKEGIDAAWDFLEWLGSKLTTLVTNLVKGAETTFESLKVLGGTLVQKIKDGITTAWDVATWMYNLLVAWWTDLTAGPNSAWLTNGVQGAGAQIVANLKAGIRASWDNFLKWWRDLLDKLNPPEPDVDPESLTPPGWGIPKPGGPLSPKRRGGNWLNPDFNFTTDTLRARLEAQLQEARRMLSGGLGLSVIQNYTFGDLVFPNVRDGRDATGIERQLSQLTLQGRLVARTTGA